jgi:hypothetical protein
MPTTPTTLFRNCFECSVCGTTWTDEWSCQCDDRCPKCNTETEPYDSKEIGPTS